MPNKNGHDDSENQNVTRFPDPRERREIEHRLRAANDRADPKREPILNLPPAVKYLCLALIIPQALIQMLEWAPEDWHGIAIINWLIENFSFILLRYSGEMSLGWQGLVSPVTYMFLHGGWVHLVVNVLTLASFGSGFERFLGGKRLVVIFMTTGVIGAFTQFAALLLYGALGETLPHADAPLIGASGGISGVVGATLLLLQEKGLMGEKGKFPVGMIIFLASFLLLGFFGMPGVSQPIAWVAHLGGFVAGLLLYRPVARSKIFG
ncbi:MAG: rhomboid family intramembrane serine protease [Alphaproteobacteria bacterium]|nr:MAG: rhomboid family intramembrane serine protease [Alphaproteobacteria bacterium]